MEYQLILELAVLLKPNADNTSSQVLSCDVNLGASPNVDMSSLLNKDNTLTPLGYSAITNLLVQGLTANIAAANEAGVKPDYEHLSHVIDELQRAFVTIKEVEWPNKLG